ncbi:MAG TPA: hypothetical protein VGY98_00740 [Verrucomicrobiae bacterium]|nr:hypothetical protein [Verrucomicrobiae bacterium]
MKIEFRDPGDSHELRLHPLNKRIPAFNEDDNAEWASFKIGLSAAGPHGIPPIVITAPGDIMDGKRRWLAAKELGWAEIKCEIRPEQECATLVVESLLAQRTLLRGAKVYLALGLYKEFAKAAEQRRLEHLQNGLKTLEKPLSSTELTKVNGRPRENGSLRELAEKFGTSVELVRQAIDLRSILDGNEGLRVVWEAEIFKSHKPVGIGAALAGIGGAATDQSGREKGVEQSTFAFYEGLFRPIAEKNYHWGQLSQQRREQIVARWTEEARKWKPELRSAIMKAIQEAK